MGKDNKWLDFDLIGHTLWIRKELADSPIELDDPRAKPNKLVLEDIEIKGYKFKWLDMRAAVFYGVRFINCEFSDCVLNSSEFAFSTFDNCKFKKCEIKTPYLENAEFINCEFKYVDFNSSSLRGTGFTKCKLEYCDFNGAFMDYGKLVDCKFKQCQFYDAGLYSTDFNGSYFRECDLTNSAMDGSRIENARIDSPTPIISQGNSFMAYVPCYTSKHPETSIARVKVKAGTERTTMSDGRLKVAAASVIDIRTLSSCEYRNKGKLICSNVELEAGKETKGDIKNLKKWWDEGSDDLVVYLSEELAIGSLNLYKPLFN